MVLKKIFQKRGSVALLIAAVLGVIFYQFPQIDIAVSQFFYRNGAWVIDGRAPVMWWCYHALPTLGQVLMMGILVLWILSFSKKFSRFAPRRRYFAFLVVATLLGPVTITESLKSFYSRPRPINTQIFGGELPFRPAFRLVDKIGKNRAFVSGHVAASTMIFAFFWFVPKVRRRRLFAYLSLFPIVVGIARIVVGGHYLSDCIFGFFGTYFAIILAEKLVFPRST